MHISNGSCSYSRSLSNINKLKKDFQKHFLYNSPGEKKFKLCFWKITQSRKTAWHLKQNNIKRIKECTVGKK